MASSLQIRCVKKRLAAHAWPFEEARKLLARV